MTPTTVAPADVGRACPYCRFPLKGDAAAERCDACDALHHADCWQDGGGCAVHGCAQAATVAAAPVTTKVVTALPPVSPPPPPTSPPPPSEPVPPPDTGSSRRGLVIGLAAGLAVAMAAVGGFALASGGSKDETATTTPAAVATQSSPTATGPVASPSDPSPAPAETADERESRLARRIAAIVTSSQAGRSAVRSGRYADAIANRRTVLRRLQSLSGATGRLAGARTTLGRAMEASLQSDESYAGGADASSSDAEATRLKAVFARQWAPIADAHGLSRYGAGDF